MSEVENMEIVEEAVSNYELRPLVASDMGAICKIITAIGVRQLKSCFNSTNYLNEEGTVDRTKIEAMGMEIAFDIAGVIISNIPKAEEEIQAFVASVTGLKLADVKKIPFAEYGELIIQIVMKKEFRDFFNRVMKLFNQ